MHKFAMTALAGALLAASPLASSDASAQQLEVKRSTAPTMKAGQKVTEAAKFSVPSGTEVEFFKLPAGPTYTIKGPYEGTLAEYANPCPWWKAATGACKKEELDTGGTRGAAEVPGATRGIRKPAQQPQQ
jgi:hypothetical protein